MKRLLIITGSQVSPNFGAGQIALNISEVFSSNGFSVDIFSIFLEPKKSLRNYSLLLTNYTQRRMISRYLKTKKKYDIIELPNYSGLINSFIKKSGDKIILRSVQPDIHYDFYKIFSPISNLKSFFHFFIKCINICERIVLTVSDLFLCDKIMLLGTSEFNWFVKFFPFTKNKCFKYFISINPSEHFFYKSIKRERCSKVSFLWIGRWVDIKGTRKVMKIITDNVSSNVRFTVAGTGHVSPSVLEFFNKYEVNHIPFFSRSDLPIILSQSNFGFFTSYTEGWGLVLNEMLESGLIVFSTRVGGFEDLKIYFPNQLFEISTLNFNYLNNFTSSSNNSFLSWNCIYEICFKNIY